MKQLDVMLAEMRQEREDLDAAIRVLERRTGASVKAANDVELAVAMAEANGHRKAARSPAQLAVLAQAREARAQKHRLSKHPTAVRMREYRKGKRRGHPRPAPGMRTRDYVLKVLRQQPTRGWRVADLTARVQALGWTSTGDPKAVVNQCLRTMFHDKAVTRSGAPRTTAGVQYRLDARGGAPVTKPTAKNAKAGYYAKAAVQRRHAEMVKVLGTLDPDEPRRLLKSPGWRANMVKQGYIKKAGDGWVRTAKPFEA